MKEVTIILKPGETASVFPASRAGRINVVVDHGGEDKPERYTPYMSVESAHVGRTHTLAELIAAVRLHALDHYEEGGWDYVVESWEDQRIRDIIAEDKLTTPEEVIVAVGKVVGVVDDVRRDVQAAAGCPEAFE